MKYEFIECDICRPKPGTPALCNACLRNREAIIEREAEIKRLREALTVIDRAACTLRRWLR